MVSALLIYRRRAETIFSVPERCCRRVPQQEDSVRSSACRVRPQSWPADVYVSLASTYQFGWDS